MTIILPKIKEIKLPPKTKTKDGDEVFVGLNFKVSGDKLVFTGGFAKDKNGISKTHRAKIDDKKALKSKKDGVQYL